MRRFLKWLAATVVFVLLIGAGCFWWLWRAAAATPEFYQSIAIAPSQEDRAARAAEAESAVRSLLVPQLPRANDVETVVEEESAETWPEGTGDPKRGTEQSKAAAEDGLLTSPRPAVAFTHDQINAWIARELEPSGGELGAGVSDPRMQFVDGRLRLGLRLNTPDFRGVVSAELRPQLTTPQTIAFDIQRLSLGNVRLPTGALLRLIDPATLNERVQLDTDADPPRLTFDWTNKEDAPFLASIVLKNGEVKITPGDPPAIP